MKKISARQLLIFYCIYSFSIKFLALPQLLSLGSAQDAWIAALIGTAIELLLLFVTINVLAVKTSRFVMPFMFALLMFQMFILIGISHSLVTQNLFHGFGNQTFLIPLIIFGMMFCFVSARAIFRSGEIFYLLIILGLAISVAPAIPRMNFSELTPIGGSGFGSIMMTVLRNLIFFESAIFLLVFAGDVEITKNFRTKFMAVGAIVGVVFILFMILAVTIFGPLAQYKSIAVVDLTIHSSFITQGGRIDWFLMCIWLLLIMMRFGVTFYCAFACVRHVLCIKKYPRFIGIGIGVVLWAVWTFAIVNMGRLNHFMDYLAVSIVIASIVVVVPLVCFVIKVVRRV